MSAIHVKIIRGHEYAYEVTSYWDKELKKCRKKTKYIGRVIDKENGVYEKLSDRSKNTDDNFYQSLVVNFGDTFCVSEHFKKSPYGIPACAVSRLFATLLKI